MIDSLWVDEGIDWDRYKSIEVEPAFVAGVSQMNWWHEIGRQDFMLEDLAELSWAVNYELKKILATIPNKKFQIVERVGSKTLKLEVLITEYQPTSKILKQMSSEKEPFIGSRGVGRLSYEVKLIDPKEGTVFFLKDHEIFDSPSKSESTEGEWYEPVLKGMYHFKIVLNHILVGDIPSN